MFRSFDAWHEMPSIIDFGKRIISKINKTFKIQKRKYKYKMNQLLFVSFLSCVCTVHAVHNS